MEAYDGRITARSAGAVPCGRRRLRRRARRVYDLSADSRRTAANHSLDYGPGGRVLFTSSDALTTPDESGALLSDGGSHRHPGVASLAGTEHLLFFESPLGDDQPSSAVVAGTRQSGRTDVGNGRLRRRRASTVTGRSTSPTGRGQRAAEGPAFDGTAQGNDPRSRPAVGGSYRAYGTFTKLPCSLSVTVWTVT